MSKRRRAAASRPLPATRDADDASLGQESAARAHRWVLAGILALFFGWGITYLVVNPWNGGMDELLHRNYVQVLAEERRLPWIDAYGARYREAHAMHPPAYYITLVPVYWAFSWSEPVLQRVMRACSLVYGAITIVLVFRIALRAFRGDLPLAAAATAFVALTPLYLCMGSMVNNDVPSVLVVVWLLYLGLVCWDGPLTWKRVCALGAVAGIAGLTKGTSEVAAVVAGSYLVYSGSRSLGRGPALVRVAAFVAIAVAIVAPWHARNLALYGSLSYMPRDAKPAYLPVDEGILVCLMFDNFPRVLRFTVKWILNTLWSQKEWIPEPIRTGLYRVLWGAVIGGGVLGAVARRAVPTAHDGRTWVAQFWVGAPLYAMAVYIACFIHMGWAMGGRYLLPMLPGVALLMCAWGPLLRGRLAPAKWALVAIVVLGGMVLNAICLHELAYVLIPMHQLPA